MVRVHKVARVGKKRRRRPVGDISVVKKLVGERFSRLHTRQHVLTYNTVCDRLSLNLIEASLTHIMCLASGSGTVSYIRV